MRNIIFERYTIEQVSWKILLICVPNIKIRRKQLLMLLLSKLGGEELHSELELHTKREQKGRRERKGREKQGKKERKGKGGKARILLNTKLENDNK